METFRTDCLVMWSTYYPISRPPTSHLENNFSFRNGPPPPKRPLIVIVSQPNTPISGEIVSYYSSADIQRARWNRLARELNWVYLDMYYLFTKWERVLGTVKRNLEARIAVGIPFTLLNASNSQDSLGTARWLSRANPTANSLATPR
jgi:hypothetical protein